MLPVCNLTRKLTLFSTSSKYLIPLVKKKNLEDDIKTCLRKLLEPIVANTDFSVEIGKKKKSRKIKENEATYFRERIAEALSEGLSSNTVITPYILYILQFMNEYCSALLF